MRVFEISIFLLKGQILSLATSLPVLTFALTMQKPRWCLSRVSDSHLDWQSRQWKQRQIQFHLNRFMMKQYKLLILLNINMVLKIFFIMKWQVCTLYGCSILSQQWGGGGQLWVPLGGMGLDHGSWQQVSLRGHLPGRKEGLCALSCLTLENLWTVALQAPLSMRFSRQEYWSGLSFPSFHWIFPTQGSNQGLSQHRQILYHLNHQGTCVSWSGSFLICCTGCQ